MPAYLILMISGRHWFWTTFFNSVKHFTWVLSYTRDSWMIFCEVLWSGVFIINTYVFIIQLWYRKGDGSLLSLVSWLISFSMAYLVSSCCMRYHLLSELFAILCGSSSYVIITKLSLSLSIRVMALSHMFIKGFREVIFSFMMGQ